jgi:hypothetical protein
MASLDSSSLESADYDPKKRQLTVLFRHGGRYRYAQVPRRIYRDLLAAESKGRFFTRHIRGYFRFEKLEEQEDGVHRKSCDSASRSSSSGKGRMLTALT